MWNLNSNAELTLKVPATPNGQTHSNISWATSDKMSVFGIFMRLALEGLKISRNPIVNDFCIHSDKFILG